MAAEHNGLQAKIKAKWNSAVFVHCYAHRLNLVLSQSVNCIKQCKVFFHSLTGFALFFSKSTNRSYAFDEQIKKRFPTVEPTRWNSNSTTFLLDIIENPGQWDSDTLISASGLYSCLMDFEFNFLLQMFSKIFPSSDNLCDTLLEKCFDISCCSKKVDDFIHDLQSRRNDFDLVWDSLKNEEELGKAQSRKRRKVDNVESWIIQLKNTCKLRSSYFENGESIGFVCCISENT
ncbi:hypothetical protein CBL_08372 [Carabus blaptoides fortunei]